MQAQMLQSANEEEEEGCKSSKKWRLGGCWFLCFLKTRQFSVSFKTSVPYSVLAACKLPLSVNMASSEKDTERLQFLWSTLKVSFRALRSTMCFTSDSVQHSGSPKRPLEQGCGERE